MLIENIQDALWQLQAAENVPNLKEEKENQRSSSGPLKIVSGQQRFTPFKKRSKKKEVQE